jgi:hypothetical protein
VYKEAVSPESAKDSGRYPTTDRRDRFNNALFNGEEGWPLFPREDFVVDGQGGGGMHHRKIASNTTPVEIVASSVRYRNGAIAT